MCGELGELKLRIRGHSIYAYIDHYKNDKNYYYNGNYKGCCYIGKINQN